MCGVVEARLSKPVTLYENRTYLVSWFCRAASRALLAVKTERDHTPRTHQCVPLVWTPESRGRKQCVGWSKPGCRSQSKLLMLACRSPGAGSKDNRKSIRRCCGPCRRYNRLAEVVPGLRRLFIVDRTAPCHRGPVGPYEHGSSSGSPVNAVFRKSSNRSVPEVQ